MKLLFILCAIALANFVYADSETVSRQPPSSLKGKILETKDVEKYTYLRLKTINGEVWAAIGKSSVKKGSEITLDHVTEMKNFESKTLKRTFETIYFGQPTGTVAQGEMVKQSAVHIAKASGNNAKTIVEITQNASNLKGSTVLVRGQVVKYTPDVLGKNWIHLQDGSGDAADKTNDILVTTNNPAKIGDVMTVKGVVQTNKDFGAGYAYKVLIEDASFQP